MDSVRLLSRLHTKEENTYCLCGRKGSKENLLTGHDSIFKIWSIQERSLIQSVVTPVKGDVTCICPSPANVNHFAVSVDTTVVYYDQRTLSKPLFQFQFNAEEINTIDIHNKGSFLCACDDAGEIKVIDIDNGKLFKTLSRTHSNICSAVKFNPRKPWEILSGGLDCKIVRWDFSRGRPLFEVSTQSTNEDSGSYMVNPPMVHSIDAMGSNFSVACGLGDGRVAVYSLKGKGIEPVCLSRLHSTAVSQVCCVPLGEGKQVIVSGGNDGRVLVSELKEEIVHSGRSAKKTDRTKAALELKVVSEINHLSKVNWLDIQPHQESVSSGYSISVADQTQFVSFYHVDL